VSVFRRNGKWVVDYWPQGRKGKHIRTTLPATITAKADAVAIERELRQANKDPEINAPKNATVSILFPQYLDYYKLHRKPSTYKDICSVYKNHLQRHLGRFIASEIELNHFNVYKQLRTKEYRIGQKKKKQSKEEKLPISNRTVMKELAYFSGFLDWCGKNIKGFPVKNIEIEKLPWERPVPLVLTFEEAIRLVMAAEPFYRVLFLVMFNLGLRLTPARKMRWEDIDFENRTFRIILKGGKWKLLPLSDWLYAELKKMHRTATSAWAFPSPRPWLKDQPVTEVRKAIRRAAKTAGITKRVYPHLLRHSLATHLLGKDINQKTVQEMLGHADIQSTQWYTQVLTSNLRKALKNADLNVKPKAGVYRKRPPDKDRPKKRIRDYI
jgi:integrase